MIPTSSIESLMEFWKNSREEHCRSCGKKEQLSGSLCTVCNKKIAEIELQKKLKMLIPLESEVHCYSCFSHISGCICEKKTKLDALKS